MRFPAIWLSLLFNVTTIGLKAAPPVAGFCYTGELGKPVAGALVALYGADGLLRSSTYTIDSGQFTLMAPDTPGDYFLVATSGSHSQRAEFKLDPKQPARMIPPIVFQKEKTSFVDYLKYLGGKLDYVLTAFLGFIIGLMTKRWDNKRLFNIHRVRMAVACDDAIKEGKELTTVLDKWQRTTQGSPDRDTLQADWQGHLTATKHALDDLDAARPDVTVVYGAKGKKGFDDLRNLKRSVEEIRGLPARVDAIGNLRKDERQAKMKPLDDLAKNSLTRG